MSSEETKKENQTSENPKENPTDSKLSNILGGSIDTTQRKQVDLNSLTFSKEEASGQFESIKKNIIANLSSLNSPDLKSRDEVIQHVGESIQDIAYIESKPKLSLSQLHTSFADFQEKLENMQTNIIHKRYSIDVLKNYVSHIIDTTGPNRDTTALLSTISFDSEKYLGTHTMNVLMITLSTAIELTKVMKNKLLTKDVCSDLQKVLICNKKIFSRRELINLGIAAILHDLYLIKEMPNLHKTTKLALKDESIIEKHPSEGYHFLKSDFGNIDFDVKRAVYQHHEYIDGSGFPNGIDGRLFSRYSYILSFAVYYVMRITENPFRPLKHPHIVLHQMLSNQRSKFDSDVLLAYTKAASLYPIGCWVILNTGQIGIVCKSHPDNPRNPMVKALLNSKFETIESELIDTVTSEVKVTAPVAFLEIKKRVPEYFKLIVAES